MTRKGDRRAVEFTARYKAYEKITEYALAHRGNTPNERILAKLVGKHPSTVRGYVRDLQTDGLIQLENGEIVVVGSRWYPPRRRGKRGISPPVHVRGCTG